MDVDKHLTYAAQQRLDGYAEAIHHAIRRKATFDKKVLKSRAGITTFRRGQLVQVYRSDLMNTLSTDRKLQPTWSGPYRVSEQILNLYRLENLDGSPKTGEYSARRLRAFTPREGTDLARAQKEFEERGRETMVEREGLDLNLETETTNIEEQPVSQDVEDGDRTEEEDSTIGSRVAGRRGHRQKEGGGWNR